VTDLGPLSSRRVRIGGPGQPSTGVDLETSACDDAADFALDLIGTESDYT